MNAERRHAAHPDVVAQTTGLVNFLRDMVHSSHQRQRDDRSRERERLWLADLPEQVSRPTPRDDGMILRLDHVSQSTPPELPEVLDGWVDPLLCMDADGIDPPLAEHGPGRSHLPALSGATAEDDGATVSRDEAGEVQRAYGPWLDRWRKWAERERRERPLRALYDKVYAWHQRLALEDDRTELVLAVGLLTWSQPDADTVHRHLLTQRLETSVDRRTARVTVRLSAEGALRLEDQDFLDTGDGWVRERGAALAEEIAARSTHPLHPDALELLSQWQERATEQRIAFSARWQPPQAPEPAARLTYAPALVLRPRNLNALLRVYSQIADAIVAEGHAPLGLAQMVMNPDPAERAAWDGRGMDRAPLFGDDPLFPGKTNEQQRSVLRRLEKETGVVVQGPPGTGKTHTIANLLSALLAQGQRVLVTSARDQPLTVLRDKLPPAVRDLCVLLLSSTRQDGTSELDRTVTALTEQVAGADTETLHGEIERLSRLRLDTRGRINTLTEQVLSLREEEYRHRAVAPGYDGTLAQIVQRVQDQAEANGWIGALPEGATTAPPLTAEQAQELMLLLRDGAGEPRSGGALPALEQVPSAHEVANTFAASRLTDEGLTPQTVKLRNELATLAPEITDEVTLLLESAATSLHHLGLTADTTRWGNDSWITRALTQRLARTDLALWDRVAATTTEISAARRSMEASGLRPIRLPQDLDADQAGRMVTTGQALRDHLEAKGGRPVRERMQPLASRAQKNAHEILTLCTIDGRAPRTVEDLDHVLARLRAHIALDAVAVRWQQAGAPLPNADIEVQLAELDGRTAQLQHIAAFARARENVDALLVRQGVRLLLTTRETWQDLVLAMTALSGRRAADDALAQLARWDADLSATPAGEHPSEEARALVTALRDQDLDAYAKAVEALELAHRQDANRRQCAQLLNTLRAAHPLLAGRLLDEAHDPAWDHRLAALERAWAWGKAAQFITVRRTPGLEHKLDAQLTEQETRLEEVTGELAAAWGRLHCRQNMTQEQKSALQAYRTHMASVGRGKGRSAGHFRAAARERMTVAQGAVPAWVMPIAQVAEMIQAQRHSFDVVIVDEASQAGMDALFLLWLAPRVIVVGDDKQCAPPLSGKGRHQAIRDKLAAHLPDMPTGLRELYMPHTNLYGLLTTFFPEVIRLDEHFRCVPEIINWSSSTFYDNKLLPLRQYGGERLEPLRTTFVEDAATVGREGRIHNPKEAEAIVETLERMTADAVYQDKTIGVIVLQGFGQTKFLQNLIEKRISPTAREHHRIRVGNAASFQGDERHVILLSMVVTDPPRIAGGSRPEQQAYNVAASRAQDQMWLFHSVPHDRLRTNDLRLNLLTYMDNPPAALALAHDIGPVRPDVPTQPFQSLFEQQVYLQIKERGYHVLPQYPAGTKSIDLVVVGARGRLAVECDGEYFHHTTREQIDRDHQRDRELRRVGWRFWRVRESEFRFDPEEALNGLWDELDRLDIRPADYSSTPAAPTTSAPWTPLALPDATDDTEADEADTSSEQDATGMDDNHTDGDDGLEVSA
ncbi:AAA domain-containing protein [Streptomyces hokutonensis]|uniref:AAA domain-containing protein n=1 Tax=Streptomyces hokutonensis TaxID=1306990 RepID=UPI00036BC01D|nr:AAA domain-containing protein [Streptomyces hokutonensis]